MNDEERGQSLTTSDSVWPYDEDVVPLDEAALAQNHDLIDLIRNAAVDGPAMTVDEFKAWLDQLRELSRKARVQHSIDQSDGCGRSIQSLCADHVRLWKHWFCSFAEQL